MSTTKYSIIPSTPISINPIENSSLIHPFYTRYSVRDCCGVDILYQVILSLSSPMIHKPTRPSVPPSPFTFRVSFDCFRFPHITLFQRTTRSLPTHIDHTNKRRGLRADSKSDSISLLPFTPFYHKQKSPLYVMHRNSAEDNRF